MSETPTNEAVQAVPPPPAPPAAARRRGPSTLQLAVVVAIMAGGILLTVFTSDVTKTSEPGIRLVNDKPYLEAQVGDWHGGPLEGLSKGETDILPKDTEGARRLYRNSQGKEVYCSVVLAGRDVTSIHRPEMCLPGQGWKIQSEYVEPIQAAAAPGGVFKVMRMNAAREVTVGENRTVQTHSIFAYWFVGKHRTTAYHWQRILWTTRDRLLHNTNHRWAYILLHAPVPAGNAADQGPAAEETMHTVAGFVQALYPTLMTR